MVRPLIAVVLIQADPMLHVIVLHQVVKAGGNISVGIRDVSHHTLSSVKPVHLKGENKSVWILLWQSKGFTCTCSHVVGIVMQNL